MTTDVQYDAPRWATQAQALQFEISTVFFLELELLAVSPSLALLCLPEPDAMSAIV